jgi:hypothetical protein
MHTLDDIMGIAPAADNTNGAVPGDVLQGTSYWGLRTDGTWGPQTGTATYLPAPVPKTWQTKKDHDGDDGDLQKGVAWPDPRFMDNGDGTVTDNLTGLIWLRDATCLGRRQWTDGNDAFDQVNKLNSGEDFGCDGYAAGTFDDWRLPNVRELQSLIDYGRVEPALPDGYDSFFSFTPADPGNPWADSQYWSSTTRAYPPGTSEDAWWVYLSTGLVSYDSKTNDYRVWPVRGGQ